MKEHCLDAMLDHPVELPPLAPSLPLEPVVHDETYRDPDDAELLRHFEEKEEYFREWLESLPDDSKVRRLVDAKGVENLARWVSPWRTRTASTAWRDDVISTNLALSELE